MGLDVRYVAIARASIDFWSGVMSAELQSASSGSPIGASPRSAMISEPDMPQRSAA